MLHDINIFDNTIYLVCMAIYVHRIKILVAMVIYAVVCINTELHLGGLGGPSPPPYVTSCPLKLLESWYSMVHAYTFVPPLEFEKF